MVKEDLRIKRTKGKIKEALIALSGEKNFDNISITEICNKAKITRKTFYNNYSDKFKLALNILQDFSKQSLDYIYRIINGSNSITDLKGILTMTVDNISSTCFNHKKNIIKIDRYYDNSYFILLEEFAIKETNNFLSLISNHYHILNWNKISETSIFFVNGFLSYLLAWAQKENSTKKEISDFLIEIFNNLFALNSFLKKID